MPVLAEVPKRVWVYRAKRRGARPALLAKSLPELFKLREGGLIDDAQLEAQCTLLVDQKAGRPILRALDAALGWVIGLVLGPLNDREEDMDE